MMDKLAGYNAYQTDYYNKVDKRQKAERRTSTDATKKTQAAQKKGQTGLSDKARALLEEMKKRFGNMDIIVAGYENEDNAKGYLSRSMKEFSVLIDAEELERMAEDDALKEKNFGIIEDAEQSLKAMKTQLEESGEDVVRVGINIDNNGEVTYFADLQKLSDAQKERIEKLKEEKAEEKKAEKKKGHEGKSPADMMHPSFMEPYKKTQVQASSVQELLQKIQSVNWDEIPVNEGHSPIQVGKSFDLSI